MRVKGAANWQSGMSLFRGRFQAYGHPKYGMVITKWPRKRGSKRTAAQKLNNDNFAQVVAWCRDPMAADVEIAQYFTVGTGFLPRDLMEACCYGNVVIAQMSDGRMLYGRRTVTADAQALLDTITPNLGAMLIRTPAGWIGLDAGPTAGYVLTNTGPGVAPGWGPPSAGGGGGQPVTWTSSTISTFQGAFHRPATQITLTTGKCLHLKGLIKRAGTGNASLGIINAAGTAGWVIAAQHDGNLVCYRLNSGSVTALKASSAGSTSANTGYCLIDLMITVDHADGNNISGGFHGYMLPPVSDATYDLTTGTWYLAAFSDNLIDCGTATLIYEPS